MKSLSISHNITTFQWSLQKISKSVAVDPHFHWNWFSWHFYYVMFFVCLVFVGWIFSLRCLFYALPSHIYLCAHRLFGCLFIFCLVRMVFHAFDIIILYFISVKPMERAQYKPFIFIMCRIAAFSQITDCDAIIFAIVFCGWDLLFRNWFDTNDNSNRFSMRRQ